MPQTLYLCEASSGVSDKTAGGHSSVGDACQGQAQPHAFKAGALLNCLASHMAVLSRVWAACGVELSPGSSACSAPLRLVEEQGRCCTTKQHPLPLCLFPGHS